MLAVFSLQWCQGNNFGCVWVCPIGACYLHPPESSLFSPPLLCLPVLSYTGLSAPQALEHYVSVFQLQRENRASFSRFLFCCVDIANESDNVSFHEIYQSTA